MGTTPQWIANEAARAEQQRVASEASAQQAIEDSFTIQKQGPAFWKELLESLTLNTDALPQLPDGFKGRTSRLGDWQCQIEVSKTGMIPNLRQINLFYNPGSPVIRACANALDSQEVHFAFVVSRKGELCIRRETGPIMNASEMAESLTHGMVNALRRD